MNQLTQRKKGQGMCKFLMYYFEFSLRAKTSRQKGIKTFPEEPQFEQSESNSAMQPMQQKMKGEISGGWKSENELPKTL